MAEKDGNGNSADNDKEDLSGILSAFTDCADAISDFDTFTSVLPAAWAPYLFNGDSSGFDNREQETIDAWIERNGLGAPVDCGESYFSINNDANNLGGDVSEFTWLVAKT